MLEPLLSITLKMKCVERVFGGYDRNEARNGFPMETRRDCDERMNVIHQKLPLVDKLSKVTI